STSAWVTVARCSFDLSIDRRGPGLPLSCTAIRQSPGQDVNAPTRILPGRAVFLHPEAQNARRSAEPRRTRRAPLARAAYPDCFQVGCRGSTSAASAGPSGRCRAAPPRPPPCGSLPTLEASAGRPFFSELLSGFPGFLRDTGCTGQVVEGENKP